MSIVVDRLKEAVKLLPSHQNYRVMLVARAEGVAVDCLVYLKNLSHFMPHIVSWDDIEQAPVNPLLDWVKYVSQCDAYDTNPDTEEYPKEPTK